MQSRLIKRKVTLKDMDTVKARQKKVGLERDPQLVERIERLWDNMSDFREKLARATRFTYGDQWGDTIEVNGMVMTQRQYLMKQGNAVIQSNQIKSKVDTIVGVMVKEKNEPVCNAHDRSEQQYGEVMTMTLQANCNKNKIEGHYIKWMKDLCLGGLAVARESWDDVSGPERKLDSWTKYCNPNQVFLDSEMNDPRFWDMTIIGQFFDMSFEDLAAMFAKSAKDYAILRDIYHQQNLIFRQEPILQLTDKLDDHQLVFRYPYDPAKCRVFEVWTKETKARIRLHDWNEGTEEIIDADDYEARKQVKAENARRKNEGAKLGFSEDEIPYITGDGVGQDGDENGFFIDTFWYCRFLAPDGSILWEGESPYADRCHPFSICATPFVNGTIVGYMWDSIDHNMAINRAAVLHDWLVRRQAKGVTVVPKAIVPKDMRLEDFAESWTSIDDMVFIDMKEGQEGLMPRMFTGAAQNFNVSELINTYSKLLENSTAVSGAIQGKTPYSGTSGSLYAQMTNNASTPIASLLSQFHTFIEDVHTKKMKNIVMFYDTERFAQIAGQANIIFDENLNLADVSNIEYDLKIKESTETPVYRAIINDDAKEFLMNGLISMEEYLTIATVPYADKLLQMRQARQAEMEQAQQNGQIPEGSPEDQAQAMQMMQ